MKWVHSINSSTLLNFLIIQTPLTRQSRYVGCVRRTCALTGQGRGARYITDFDSRLICCTIFHEDSKNMYNFFSKLDTPNRRTSSAHVACSRVGTWAAWAEVVRQLGVSNLEKKLYFWNPHEKLYKISIGHLNRTKFF